MAKTFIGPKLRQIRRAKNQTQAEMAKALSVSTAYVNLLENNQRSLSVKMLVAIADIYGLDLGDLVKDDASIRFADLRNAIQDPLFAGNPADVQELRAAIDHSPQLVDHFLTLYKSHRNALERIMRLGSEGMPDDLVAMSDETLIHDFFRSHSNHFAVLEEAAREFRQQEAFEVGEVYVTLKSRLKRDHGIDVRIMAIEEMPQALRHYDTEASVVRLSEALDHQNRIFQLAHVLCFIEYASTLENLTSKGGILSQPGRARCHVELANYFAAALLMPYDAFLHAAERNHYDIDRLSASFNVSFEQACHRLTTLQREGSHGVPFFFLRIDKAGNVTKRFNSTSFNLAEYGGACPVWNIHTSFRSPGVIVPQFVEMPDGGRFFTISRTTQRPVFNHNSQDRMLALALGCEMQHASRIGYAAPFNTDGEGRFDRIGINCHLCPRQACAQRAHRPLFFDLPIDTNWRGNTRYES